VLKSALQILASLFWFWKRKLKQQDDPIQQNRERHKQIDDEVATGDSTAATDHGLADLNELERMRNEKGHPK